MNQVSGDDRPFLGVEESITGRRWAGIGISQDALALAMAQQTGLPDPICRILVRQGVSPGEAQSYLDPNLRDMMPDPSTLMDMDRAVERFVLALDRQESIAVLADYDVDGASSAALLIWWLRAVGQETGLYIPDRIEEGFGPNSAAMAQLAAQHSLIICVDCGTSAHDAIAAADGADVIVIDHHAGEETLPPAHSVVNPNRQDEVSELVYLCAAGIVFMFLVAVNRALRPRRVTLPDLFEMLDLVALATVADVSPLISLNRALVRRGLDVMKHRRRPGLRALADVGRMDSAPNSYHLGFILGPRINAGGRIGDQYLGARLLAADDMADAERIAGELDSLNDQRKIMVETVIEDALSSAQSSGVDAPLVWAASREWHPGVVGLAASRLSEETNRPAIVIGIGDQTGKGSARSIAGVDIGAAILRCKREGLLVSGGGHKMAAGLEVQIDKIGAAMERLTTILAHSPAEMARSPGLRIDGAIQPGGISVELIESMEKAGPFGAGCPSPCFVLPNQRVSYSRRVGTTHLQLDLAGEAGDRIKAIAFRAFESELGGFLENSRSSLVHIAGRLQADHFRGNVTAKVAVTDAAPA